MIVHGGRMSMTVGGRSGSDFAAIAERLTREELAKELRARPVREKLEARLRRYALARLIAA